MSSIAKEDAMIIQMYDAVANDAGDNVLLLNKADVRHLYCDAWRRKCAFSGKKGEQMSLVPWKPHKGLKPWNLVLVNKKYARAFPVEMDTSAIANTLKNVKAHYSRNWKCLKSRRLEEEEEQDENTETGSSDSSRDSSFAEESEESEDECYDSETPVQSSDSQDQRCDSVQDDAEVVIVESSDDSLLSSSASSSSYPSDNE